MKGLSSEDVPARENHFVPSDEFVQAFAPNADSCMNLAKYYHGLVKRSWREGLLSAKKAGDCLRKAKSKVAHGEWIPYLNKYWEDSIETAQVYMRISKNWDHPRIVLARRRGFSIDSINTFIQIVRGETHIDDKRAEIIRSMLISGFASELKTFDLTELEILQGRYDEMLGPQWRKKVRREVCGRLEYDYYEDRYAYTQNESDLEFADEREERQARYRRKAQEYSETRKSLERQARYKRQAREYTETRNKIREAGEKSAM